MAHDLILTTISFSLISLLAVAIGQRWLRLVNYQGQFGQTIGLAYVLGFATIIYGVVVLGIVHLLYFWIVIGGLAAVAIWLHRDLFKLLQAMWQRSNGYFVQLYQTSKIGLILHLFLVALVLVNYCAVFAPPVDRDAIAYHLPEANLLVANHSYTFDDTIEQFYVNLPLLMETAYAFGIMLTGYSLAHLFHYALFVSLIIFLLSWLKQHYSATAAIWACLALFALDSFVRIATTALVDSAYMSLEIISVLLLCSWVKQRDRPTLIVAGAVVGVALAIKYSPVFTVAFSLGVIWLGAHWKQKLITLVYYVAPLLLFGGGWYLKNLILLGNPIYPFLFGHAGYSEVDYQATVDVTHDFQFPRTLWNYLQLPWLFFGKSWWDTPYMIENLANTPQTIAVLLGLVLLPLILLIKPAQRGITWLMAGYMVGFTLYWFFIATHLVRFLDAASVMLVILAVIGITMLEQRLRWIFITAAGVVIIVVGLYFGALRSTANTLYTSFLPHVLRSHEVSYALGRTSQLEYLQQSPILDCGYSALDYLQRNDPDAHVLDNWTEWHNYHFKFYNATVQFYTLPPDLTTDQVTNYVQANGIEYIYFSTISKADFPEHSVEYVRTHYAQRYQQEQQLLDQAELVYSFDACQLYQLAPTGDSLDEVGLTN